MLSISRPTGPDDGAHFSAPIYSVELTGEATLVTVRLDEDFIAIRTDKNFGGRIDDSVDVRISTDRTFLFDSATEQRIRA